MAAPLRRPARGWPQRCDVEEFKDVDVVLGNDDRVEAAQNAYLDKHTWTEYAAWHLGLTDGAADETKARHAFVYGDFRRLHRTALIASVYRASEWRHKEIELAAHDLLQHLDAVSAR